MSRELDQPVPQPCLGVWQRVSQEATGKPPDTTTRALWIQTSSLFADMRIPAGRPDFSGRTSLSQCGEDEMLWLARQQGIAGVTLAGEGLLHRRRQLDFQPMRGRDNVRRVSVAGDLLVEENLQGSMVEKWHRLAGPEAGVIALRLLEDAEDGRFMPRKGYLLVMGDYFLLARDRAGFIRQAHSLEDLIEAQEPGLEEMARILDCEFSFGRRRGGAQPWEIQLSTLPFREGKALFGPGQFEALKGGGSALVQRGRGRSGPVTRRWSIQEWKE